MPCARNLTASPEHLFFSNVSTYSVGVWLGLTSDADLGSGLNFASTPSGVGDSIFVRGGLGFLKKSMANRSYRLGNISSYLAGKRNLDDTAPVTHALGSAIERGH